MIEIDARWIMEGLDRKDPGCIKTCGELCDFIDKVGFLPFFKNHIKGFSVEEITASDSWWCGRTEEDPWQWREMIAGEGKIAYGKLFCSRAGFVSRKWYPILASFRRNGYDFDSRYEDGLASRRAKLIMDLLENQETMLSNDMKVAAGFGKGGEKGFEGTLTNLQMMTYITVRRFQRKRNKKNEEYGWPISVYTLSERLFGGEHVRSAYHLSMEEAKLMLADQISKNYPKASSDDIERIIRL
jgi:hypothetical protein